MNETTQPALQILETLFDELAAQRLYTVLAQQEGVTHIRLLRPSASKPGYRVQALMVGEDLPIAVVPDGCRSVMVNDRILKLFDEVV